MKTGTYGNNSILAPPELAKAATKDHANDSNNIGEELNKTSQRISQFQ